MNVEIQLLPCHFPGFTLQGGGVFPSSWWRDGTSCFSSQETAQPRAAAPCEQGKDENITWIINQPLPGVPCSVKAENPPCGHLFLDFLFSLGYLLALRFPLLLTSCVPGTGLLVPWFSAPLCCVGSAMGHPLYGGRRDVIAHRWGARCHGTCTAM